MSGKASSTNLIDEGSPPALRTEARMVVSPMFLRVLTATRLPARSAAVLIEASRVTTPPKSALSLPVEATPLDTTLRGSPRDWAISSEVTLLNPNWNWPLTTPGTIAAPPWPLSRVSSMLRLVKKPFCLPR
jgi:hypothetical protein